MKKQLARIALTENIYAPTQKLLEQEFDKFMYEFLNRRTSKYEFRIIQVFLVRRNKFQVAENKLGCKITIWFEYDCTEGPMGTIGPSSASGQQIETDIESGASNPAPEIDFSEISDFRKSEQLLEELVPETKEKKKKGQKPESSNPKPKTPIAVCVFHKNAIHYPQDWVHACIKSLGDQTRRDFQVFELNYGTDDRIIVNDDLFDNVVLSYNKPFESHVGAQNWLFDKVTELGYDYIFNVNIDDYYTNDRMAKQLIALEEGAELVSSNWQNINEKSEHIGTPTAMHSLDVLKESDTNHNIIAHPVVAMTADFWKAYRPYDEMAFLAAKQKNEAPHEDFDMWIRAAINNAKIKILPDVLLYHRIHGQNTGKGDKKK